MESCSIDSRNEQSPTSEVVHETKKVHFRNLNRFLVVKNLNARWLGQAEGSVWSNTTQGPGKGSNSDMTVILNFKCFHLRIKSHAILLIMDQLL